MMFKAGDRVVRTVPRSRVPTGTRGTVLGPVDKPHLLMNTWEVEYDGCPYTGSSPGIRSQTAYHSSALSIRLLTPEELHEELLGKQRAKVLF